MKLEKMGTGNLETLPSTLEASGGHRGSPPGNVKLPFGRWLRVTHVPNLRV